MDIYDVMKSVSLDTVSQAAFSLPLLALDGDGDDDDEEEQGAEGCVGLGGLEKHGTGTRMIGPLNHRPPPTHQYNRDQATDGTARQLDGRRIDQLAHAAFTLLGQAMRNPIPYAERFGLNPAFWCVLGVCEVVWGGLARRILRRADLLIDPIHVYI